MSPPPGQKYIIIIYIIIIIIIIIIGQFFASLIIRLLCIVKMFQLRGREVEYVGFAKLGVV